MPDIVRGLVGELGPYADRVVTAFGIPDHLLAAPIAGDCECFHVVVLQQKCYLYSDGCARLCLCAQHARQSHAAERCTSCAVHLAFARMMRAA